MGWFGSLLEAISSGPCILNDDGIGIAASFTYPGGITTDGRHLFVAVGGNSQTVRKVQSSPPQESIVLY